ncbi:hypothetical protein D3C78_1758320 [compost metagenome]
MIGRQAQNIKARIAQGWQRIRGALVDIRLIFDRRSSFCNGHLQITGHNIRLAKVQQCLPVRVVVTLLLHKSSQIFAGQHVADEG